MTSRKKSVRGKQSRPSRAKAGTGKKSSARKAKPASAKRSTSRKKTSRKKVQAKKVRTSSSTGAKKRTSTSKRARKSTAAKSVKGKGATRTTGKAKAAGRKKATARSASAKRTKKQAASAGSRSKKRVAEARGKGKKSAVAKRASGKGKGSARAKKKTSGARRARPRKKQPRKRAKGSPKTAKGAAAKVAREPRQPDTATLYRLYGEALELMHKNRYRRAQQLFEQVVRNFPQEIEVQARARAFIKICRRHRAKKEKPPALTAEEMFTQGVVQHNAGRHQEALDSLSRALKLCKRRKDHIYYTMAAAEVSLGNLEEGLKLLKKALELNGENRFFAGNDPDFEPLATSQLFRELINPG